MKKLALFTLSAAVLVSSSAFAQGLTRADVRQQLVVAEQGGSQYVTNASYPSVSPVFQVQAGRLQHGSDNGYGGSVAGSGMSAAGSATALQGRVACVGPNSFCNIYAGS